MGIFGMLLIVFLVLLPVLVPSLLFTLVTHRWKTDKQNAGMPNKEEPDETE